MNSTTPKQTKLFNNDFLIGLRDSIPLVIAAMPFGLVYGALGQSIGLEQWLVMAISIFVFAGASQFIAVSLITSGSSILLIVLTVFFVNLRHTLYSSSLLPHVKGISTWKRLLMGFSLTDETFAVVTNRVQHAYSQQQLEHYYLGSALFMYANWLFCTWLGFHLGNAFPTLASMGLDVAMVVAFTGIVIANLKLPSHWLCAVVAAVSGALTYSWPHQMGLLFSSVVAIAAGVWLETRRPPQSISQLTECEEE